MFRGIVIQLLIFLTIPSYASDLEGDLNSLLVNLSSTNCEKITQAMDEHLYPLERSFFKSEITQSDPEKLSQGLWKFKNDLHKKMQSIFQRGEYSDQCARELRSVFRHLRDFEDYLEEYLFRQQDLSLYSRSAFSPQNLHVHYAQSTNDLNLSNHLKSGDVLLTRGNAHTSAAIASLGEFDTQFSHMSLVHIDDAGKIWTVEAHIEVGSFVRPLEDHIKDFNFRTMVFRFQDEQLAKKAALMAFNHVQKASLTKGNILYDFGFDMDNHDKLFCSEVISWAFSSASAGRVSIPLLRNRLQIRKKSFVKKLGITALESFIPSDIEIDPRFHIIAEWRDASKINDSLQKDAVIHSMYSWADSYGYQMIQSSSRRSFLYRNIVWPLRRTPLLKIYVKDKLPLNMSRELIGYFGVLESTAEVLQEELKHADQLSVLTSGFPLFPLERVELLDEFRIKDLSSPKQKFHKFYKPVEGK